MRFFHKWPSPNAPPRTRTQQPKAAKRSRLQGFGQRSYYIARRAEIREALAPSAPTELRDEDDEESGYEIATLPKPKTGRGNTQFAAETAALTGESKRNVLAVHRCYECWRWVIQQKPMQPPVAAYQVAG